MDDREQLVGVWSVDIMYPPAAQSDDVLYFFADGTGRLDFHNPVICNLLGFLVAVRSERYYSNNRVCDNTFTKMDCDPKHGATIIPTGFSIRDEPHPMESDASPPVGATTNQRTVGSFCVLRSCKRCIRGAGFFLLRPLMRKLMYDGLSTDLGTVDLIEANRP